VQPARLGHGGSSRSDLGWELQATTPAGATVQNIYVQCFRTAPLGESRPYLYLRAGLRIPHSWCLAWLGSASVATTWGWNLAGIKEWFSLRVAASDVQLWECTIFLWTTKPI
jgi:hypothetical protein